MKGPLWTLEDHHTALESPCLDWSLLFIGGKKRGRKEGLEDNELIEHNGFKKEKIMRQVYLLPNGITAFGLACGLFVVFRMSLLPTEEVDSASLQFGAIVLLIAAFADLMDGAVARAMHAESDFGETFDSLADAVSFGVAPSVLALKALVQVPGTELSFLITMAAMIYSVCGILRLVRFSVDAHQVKADADQLLAHKKMFTGLPIPAGAAALVSATLLLLSPVSERAWGLGLEQRACLLSSAMVLLGYLMVSRWKFPSLKTLHVRVASFQLVAATVIFTVVLFYGLIYHFPVVFFSVSWLYIVTACVLSLWRKVVGKRSRLLADFEMDSDGH